MEASHTNGNAEDHQEQTQEQAESTPSLGKLTYASTRAPWAQPLENNNAKPKGTQITGIQAKPVDAEGTKTYGCESKWLLKH